MSIAVEYLGKIDYQKGLSIMNEKVNRAIDTGQSFLLALEHPLTYTAGKKTNLADILSPNIDVVKIPRGGGITLHNPGQLVIYLIFPLGNKASWEGLNLTKFIQVAKVAMHMVFLDDHTPVFHNPTNTGIYTKFGKLGFLGIATRRGVTYHGIAINLTNNLDDFKKIHSCGLKSNIVRYTDLKPNSKLLNYKSFTERFTEELNLILEQPRGSSFRNIFEKRLEANLGFSMGSILYGTNYFNTAFYWEAHESWELFWQNARKLNLNASTLWLDFLQGLIQAAMAAYKLENNNLKGLRSLAQKSLLRLKDSPYCKKWFLNAPDLIDWLTKQANPNELPVKPPILIPFFAHAN